MNKRGRQVKPKIELEPGAKKRGWVFEAYEYIGTKLGYRFRCACTRQVRVFHAYHLRNGSITQHCSKCRLEKSKREGFPVGKPKHGLPYRFEVQPLWKK